MTVPRLAATNQAAQPDTSIYITRFRSLTDPHGEQDSYADWSELCADMEANYDQIANKSDGQGWSPATFSGDTRAKKNVERIYCLVLDYDKGTTSFEAASDFWTWEAFASFRKHPFTTASMTHTSFSHSAEHPKFRVILPLSRPVDAEEFAVIWNYAAGLATQAGHELDVACKDPSRLWFWPACKPVQKVMFIPHDGTAEPVDVRRILKECGYKARSKAHGSVVAGNKPSSAIRTFERGLDEIRDAVEGTRNGLLNKVAFKAGTLVGGGRLDEDYVRKELREAALACGLDPAEVETTLHNALQDGKQRPSVGHDWDDPRLKKNKNDRIDGTVISNVILILKEHPSWKNVIRYSEFDHRIHFFSAPFNGSFYAGRGKEQKWLEDNDLTSVRSWLETEMGVIAAKETVIDAVVSVGMSQSFHQVRDWLEGLRWDGVPRIERWLRDYCGAEVETDSQKCAVPAMSKRWLISAVARAYNPGAKVDCTLVLEGEQSIRKSTTFATLVPNETWFSDERLNLDSKDTLQQIQGKWLIEIGELASFKGKANEEIKHFLTKKTDDFRKPYGKINQPYPRQCVFGGTVNDTEYLNDPTGNRRFFPVRCHGVDSLGGKIDIDGLRAVRDQLWAEAVHRYKLGEQWWLTESEDEAAQVEQEARFNEDSWQARVAEWVATGGPLGKPQDSFTMDAVLYGAVHLDPTKQGRAEQTRMKNILLRLGFVRKQVTVDGKREWRYCRKK